MNQAVEAPRRSTRRPWLVGGVAGFLVGTAATAIVAVALTGEDDSGVGVEDRFVSTVTTVGPRSICVERKEDTCGIAILVPEYDIKVGDRVEVTETWLHFDGVDKLAFYIRPVQP